MEPQARTALHQLVLLKDVQEPKLTSMVNTVLVKVFTKAALPAELNALHASRLLPPDCTQWYMRTLLQVRFVHPVCYLLLQTVSSIPWLRVVL